MVTNSSVEVPNRYILVMVQYAEIEETTINRPSTVEDERSDEREGNEHASHENFRQNPRLLHP